MQDTAPLLVSAFTNVAQVNLVLSTETGLPASGSSGITVPSSGSHQYSAGSSVAISASPHSGYRFSKWKGDLSGQDTFLRQTSIMMDQSKSITAMFCSICGDVNGDLNITPADAQVAFDIFLGILSGPTECQKENADVNNDGTQNEPHVSPADSQAIFNYFLGTSQLPGDCSCSSRKAETGSLIQTKTQVSSKINLIINDVFANPDEIVSVPVIIDNPFGISAFGFDLLFDSDFFEFVGVERTDILKDFLQVDGHEISKGVMRAGGYSHVAIQSDSPDELIRLLFKVKGEKGKRTFFLLASLFDDLARASFQKGRHFHEISRQKKHILKYN